MRHNARSLSAFAAPLLVGAGYLALSLDGLAVYPPVSDDEAWIASSAETLATSGVYGSPLLTGLFGAERRTYHHMPLYPLALAAVFKAMGPSVLSLRLLPVACGLLVLALAFLVGRGLGDTRLGGLSMLLLVGLTLGGGPFGIPLLDQCRVGRYDVAVPVFGLAALASHQRRWHPLVTGMLVGLAGLSHVYGAFMLPALVVVTLRRRGPSSVRAALWLLSGFALAWIPWLLYVWAGWSDFIGQMGLTARRFELLRPSFYWSNAVREVERYRALHLQGPGAWAAVLGVPVGLLLMLRRGVRDAADELALLLVVQAALFALLLEPKAFRYLIALWPLATVTLAWLGVRLWDGSSGVARRAILSIVFVALLGESGVQLWRRRQVATQTTPYESFATRLRQAVPVGTRILGLPRYWLGLREDGYRSWVVPFSLADGRPDAGRFRRALEELDPQIVLVDPAMAAAFANMADPGNPRHAELLAFRDFMSEQGGRLIAVVEDPTYGPVSVYALSALAGSHNEGRGPARPLARDVDERLADHLHLQPGPGASLLVVGPKMGHVAHGVDTTVGALERALPSREGPERMHFRVHDCAATIHDPRHLADRRIQLGDVAEGEAADGELE